MLYKESRDIGIIFLRDILYRMNGWMLWWMNEMKVNEEYKWKQKHIDFFLLIK